MKWINNILSQKRDKEIEGLKKQIHELELYISNLEIGINKSIPESMFIVVQQEYMFNRRAFPTTEIIYRVSGNKINLN